MTLSKKQIAAGMLRNRSLSDNQKFVLQVAKDYMVDGKVSFRKALSEHPEWSKQLQNGKKDKYCAKAVANLAQLRRRGLLAPAPESKGASRGSGSKQEHNPDVATPNLEDQVMQLLRECGCCPRCGKDLSTHIQVELAKFRMNGRA